jgi:putative transposase
MVKKQGNLSQSRQCRLLSIGWTSVYYQPKQSGRTLDLMKRLDALYTEDPTYGARRMCAALRNAVPD